MADKKTYSPIIEGVEQGFLMSFVLFVLIFIVFMFLIYLGI